MNGKSIMGLLTLVAALPVHADQDESGEAQTELFAIQQGDLADDIAVIFQLLDPSRARRG